MLCSTARTCARSAADNARGCGLGSRAGLDLADATVDGCITKARCGGEAAGKSPVDRGKQGTKRSLLVDGTGIGVGLRCRAREPARFAVTAADPGDIGFESRFGVGLPDQITIHLDAGYDSAKTRDLLEELGCCGVINPRGTPLHAGARWVVERTNSWHNRGFIKLAICTERRARVIDAFIALANASSSSADSHAPPGPATAGTPDPPAGGDLSAGPLS